MNEKIINIYFKTVYFLEKIGMPILLLFMRIWMAKIFWYSGLTKISSWQSTVLLFKEEYHVPVISPEFAAYAATAIELTCPWLLVLGIATRFATIPMICMTLVIQFAYQDQMDHYYWLMILALILCYGPGLLSVDNYIEKRVKQNAKNTYPST